MKKLSVFFGYFGLICVLSLLIVAVGDSPFNAQAAPPPAGYTYYDDFEGANIDTSLWDISDPGNVLSQSGGFLQADGPPSAVYGQLHSTKTFDGDFEIVLEYSDFQATATVFSGNYPQISLELQSQSSPGDFIFIFGGHSRSGYYVFSNGVVNGLWQHSNARSAVVSSTSGQLKISRTGSTITAHYNDGSGWIALASFPNAFTGEVVIQVQAYTGDNGTFHVASDGVYYKGSQGSNQPPIINSFEAEPQIIAVGEEVSFTCTAHDPDGDSLIYIFDLGEGFLRFSDDGTITHAYNQIGVFQTTCTVVDRESNETVSEAITIHVGNLIPTDFTFGKDTYSFPNSSKFLNPGLFASFREAFEEFPLISIGLADYLANKFYSETLGNFGYCFGMSETSILYYLKSDLKPINIDTFQYSPEQAFETIVEYQQGYVLPLLVSLTETIYEREILGIFGTRSVDQEDDYNLIKTNIQKGYPVVLSLLKSFGGHAVVAYAVVEFSDGSAQVRIYDPNYPDDKNRYISFFHYQDKYLFLYPEHPEYTYLHAYMPLTSALGWPRSHLSADY